MKYTAFILIITLLCSCDKKDRVTPTEQVIYNLKLSSHTGLADGSTMITVSVNVSKYADIARRGVIFALSSGNFTNGQNSTITVIADQSGDSITARTTFLSPTGAGTLIIRAMPNIADSNKYELKDSVVFITSAPFKITLQTSSFGLRFNYQSEDTITATVRNSLGQGVSGGVKILFEDSLLTNMPAGGKYRPSANVGVNNSRGTTNYSNGTQPIGTDILVRGTILNDAGAKTNMTDFIILKTIN